MRTVLSGVVRLCLVLMPFFAGCHKPAALAIAGGNDDGMSRVDSLPPTRDIDILVVMDNSYSMVQEQALLRQHFPLMIQTLKASAGGLPNIHLGVVTPDLGLDPYDHLEGFSLRGDRGLFRKGANNDCSNPVNQYFLVDVEPRGCTVTRGSSESGDFSCPDHDCLPEHCMQEAFPGPDGIPTEPAGLKLYLDENGCPRCRNYKGETLEEAFSCIADQGLDGCGIEQPLEAMRRALTTTHERNQGFLRPDAWLAVWILSDEDDCSYRDVAMFHLIEEHTYDPAGDISPTVIPSDFRCMVHALVCDGNMEYPLQESPAWFTNCRLREPDDRRTRLHPLDRYVDFLSGLRDPRRLMVAAAVGPFDGTIGLTENTTGVFPDIVPACGEPGPHDSWGLRVKPAPRIRGFVERMSSPVDLHWTGADLCNRDLLSGWAGFGMRISQETHCFSRPLAGCADPAFAFGEGRVTNLPPEHASLCIPECVVQEKGLQGTRTDIPACDPGYREGRPPVRDPLLPVEACYYVQYNPRCAVACPPGAMALGCDPEGNPWHAPSRGAELVISRREDPGPGIRLQAMCKGIPLRETDCSDGMDNDMDGHVDLADPDCQAPGEKAFR